MSGKKQYLLPRLRQQAESSPYWLGFFIAVALLLTRCAFDGFFLITWGFPEGTSPFWHSEVFWPEFVNAALIGYVPAVLLLARRGIEGDLAQLRPWLPGSDAEFEHISAAATAPPGTLGQVFKIIGLLLGASYVFIDPSLSQGTEQSLSNPVFMWPLLRNAVFSWLIFSLIISDINGSRTYLHIGRKLIEVDLLDVESLSPFARKGLRSALIWAIFSIIFSLYWVGEQASAVNIYVLIIVLMMATGAFITPLIGVHNNISSVKRLELDRLRGEIRMERSLVGGKFPDNNSVSPKLANLIAYYQLIDQTREWPIDAANLFRFFLYLLIGLGSWLGGAVVERLLDLSLGA